MGKTLASRLEFLISNLGIKQLDFAQRINFTQSYVSMVLSGAKTSPSPRFFDAVCREFNVNLEWLKNGKGDTYTIPGLPLQSEDAELLAKFHLLPPSEQKIVEEIINAFLLKSLSAEKGKAGKKREKPPEPAKGSKTP
jgi:transcriptional regulator with XRE-family HTH domain